MKIIQSYIPDLFHVIDKEKWELIFSGTKDECNKFVLSELTRQIEERNSNLRRGEI